MSRLTDEQIEEVEQVAATGGTFGVIRRDLLASLLAEVRALRSSPPAPRETTADAGRWDPENGWEGTADFQGSLARSSGSGTTGGDDLCPRHGALVCEECAREAGFRYGVEAATKHVLAQVGTFQGPSGPVKMVDSALRLVADGIRSLAPPSAPTEPDPRDRVVEAARYALGWMREAYGHADAPYNESAHRRINELDSALSALPASPTKATKETP
jgi:hypothetical protein